jgi:hypothetical protein
LTLAVPEKLTLQTINNAHYEKDECWEDIRTFIKPLLSTRVVLDVS